MLKRVSEVSLIANFGVWVLEGWEIWDGMF